MTEGLYRRTWASRPTAAPRLWWCGRRCWHTRPRPRSTPAARCRPCWAGWWWRATECCSESRSREREEDEGSGAQLNALLHRYIRESAGKCRRRLPSPHPRHESQSRTRRWPLTFGLLQPWGQPAAACAPDHRTTATRRENNSDYSFFHCHGLQDHIHTRNENYTHNYISIQSSEWSSCVYYEALQFWVNAQAL